MASVISSDSGSRFLVETPAETRTTTPRQGSHQKCRSHFGHLVCFSYLLLLLWQFAGSVLYFIRAYYCCVEERLTSFRCSNFTIFPHSEELELAWIASQDISIAVLAFAMSKIPGFLGYFAIFRRAICLPAFWSLTALFGIEIIGFGIIMYLNKLTSMEICLIIAFCFHDGIALIGVICVLNYTPVNPFKNLCNTCVFILCKLTQVTILMQVSILFIIGSIQLAFKVSGMDELERSATFVTVFRKLREFPQVIFYYKMVAFFWHKLFMDNRNILSHHQLLRLRHDHSIKE